MLIDGFILVRKDIIKKKFKEKEEGKMKTNAGIISGRKRTLSAGWCLCRTPSIIYYNAMIL